MKKQIFNFNRAVCFLVFFISFTPVLFLTGHTLANVTTLTFEEFLGQDGTPIGTFYPGIRFEALTGGGEDWLVCDVTTSRYNASSWPSGRQWLDGNYWIYDYAAAWTGQPGAGGKIIFDNIGTIVVEVGYCCATQLTLTAYDANGHAIDSDIGPANLRYLNGNGAGPGTLRVEAPSGTFIRSVTIHDSGNYWIVDNIVVETALDFTKTDDVQNGACRSPGQEITYTICWDNALGQQFEDAYIIDYLPVGVDYNPILSFAPLIVDPNYNSAEHYYIWNIGTIGPNTSGCVQLTVAVNDRAEPGRTLHNVAELWGTVYDSNGQNPVTVLVAKATKDTRVCCWDTNGILYVDKTATGNQTGTSWPNAYTDLQDALTRARETQCADDYVIYVAQGTYSPGNDEHSTFRLPDNIALYGGFKPGGCDFSARNPKRHETILTGRIDETTRNDTIVTMGDNALLDGFTVTDSSIDGSGIGGSSVDFTVNNCRIENNEGYGLYAQDGNVTLKWCTIRNNDYDGVYHSGESYTLTVENCWVRQSGQYGVYCLNSTPVILNSVLSESDMTREGREGIRMINPSSQPILHNLTVAHNKAAGVALFGSTLPEIQNSIVFHNGGDALAGFSADDAAWYSIIEDCNAVNFNINADPEFFYFDPNNVRISYGSPAINSGNPYLDYSSQSDMDGRQRLLGAYIDRGAYEIDCEDGANPFDWNADGVVNLYEFNFFSKAWLAHDPNDPAWLADPNLADPNVSEGWYEWKYRYNFETAGDSQYCIDLADLLFFLEDAPWLWCACWLDLQDAQTQQMMASGGEMLRMVGFEPFLLETQTVSEKTVLAQMAELANTIVQLKNLWLMEPDIQQTIDADDWSRFMEAVYQNLLDLQTEFIQ